MREFIGFALVVISMGAAPPAWTESDFQALLSLRKGFQGDTLEMKKLREEAHQEAVKLGERMIAKYRGLENLSFRLRTVYCKYGESVWHERLMAQVACQPSAVASQVLVNDKPLWWFYSQDGRLKQFKAPWNGVSGQMTEISSNPERVYLIEKVDPDIFCNIARTYRTWVGKNNWIPGMLKERFIDPFGLYAGRIKSADNEPLDIIISENIDDPLDKQWDAIYLTKRGMITRRVTVFSKIGSLVSVYDDFDESPVPSGTFAPPPELIKRSARWEKLTEKDAVTRFRALQEKDKNGENP